MADKVPTRAFAFVGVLSCILLLCYYGINYGGGIAEGSQKMASPSGLDNITRVPHINKTAVYSKDRREKIFGTFEAKQTNTHLCTFGVLRRYFVDHGYFPGVGSWTFKDRRYHPALCKLTYAVSPQRVSKCLLQNKVSSILAVGDSNALRYYSALSPYVKPCKRTKAEILTRGAFGPGKAYFKAVNRNDRAWEKNLVDRNRHCSGCGSQKSTCKPMSDKTQADITMEYLAMTMVSEDALRVRKPGTTGESLENFSAKNSQEVFFKYYLKDQYPDMILVFFPSNHVKHIEMAQQRTDMETFRSLVRTYLPESTKVFYFPMFREFASKRQVKPKNDTLANKLVATLLDDMNHMVYDVMKEDLLNSTRNTFGFFDLLQVNAPLIDWSIDGVHMIGSWYQTIMNMFWETYCNSVQLSDF